MPYGLLSFSRRMALDSREVLPLQWEVEEEEDESAAARVFLIPNHRLQTVNPPPIRCQAVEEQKNM